MKKLILLEEGTVKTNTEIQSIIRNLDLFVYLKSKTSNALVVQYAKELEPYGDVFTV